MGSWKPMVQLMVFQQQRTPRTFPPYSVQFIPEHQEWTSCQFLSSENRHNSTDFSRNVLILADGKFDQGSIIKQLLILGLSPCSLAVAKSVALHCKRTYTDTFLPFFHWKAPKPTESSLITHQAILSLWGSDSWHTVVLKLLIYTSWTRQFFSNHLLAVLIIILTF